MNQKLILEHKLVMPPTPMVLWGKTLSQMERLEGVEIGREEEGPLRDTPLPLCKLFGKVKHHGVNIV